MRGLWEKQTLGYGDSQGSPLLRKEIAALYSGVAPEQILVAAPQELVLIAMRTLLDRGDHVVCTFPGYQSLYQIAEDLGCEVTKWRPVEDEGWRFRVDELLELLRPETKLLVVNFPHNPTGALPGANDWKRIVAICAERGIRIFSDEMYRFLELDPKDRLPSACEVSETAVSLFGMSKTFGLAGLRVGWLVTRDASLLERFKEHKDYTTICAPPPCELLATMGLRAKDEIILRHRARIRRNLGLLEEFFGRHADRFTFVRPRAGTIGFPGLLRDAPDALCATALKAGVMLLPSTVYSYPRPHVRVGFGRENMPEALGRLDEALRLA